jgi:glycosyltransferase involved in cell wall biosynthesis
MLSILIPVYNYNVYPLVLELHKQCSQCNIEFEILCQDDASQSSLNVFNEKVNTLSNSNFSSNNSNLGRGKNINSIARKAKYNWLLILDCDVYPETENFIKNYLTSTTKEDCHIVFGGIIYEKNKPEREKLLRWVYGNKRESLSVEKRNEKPNSHALTSNLLIKKELFLNNPFEENITEYGYEDLIFLSALKDKNIIVKHIENPTFHLNLETSMAFLEKTKTAIANLAFIVDSKISNTIDSKIITAYQLSEKLGLTKLIVLIFKKSEPKITANLLSKKPSLLLFDLYKLGYFCTLKTK